MLEIRSAGADPQLPAVLLVSPPVSSDCKTLAASSAREGLRSVFPLVVSLECSEVLEGFRPGMVDVVLAPVGAAVAGELQHGGRLGPSQRFRALPVLRPVSPHMHLGSRSADSVR